MKIVIIGAGMAGLTLGLACQARGWQVDVFEQANQLQNIGGGIFLWTHGARYLQALNLFSLLQEELQAPVATNMLDHQGQLLLRETFTSIYQLLDGEIYPLERCAWQQRFAAALQANTLHLNKKCLAIENKHDHAKVLFADGTEVVADLVVAADGV